MSGTTLYPGDVVGGRPSMAPRLVMDDAWRHAVRRAGQNLGADTISLAPGIPVASPFRLEDPLEPSFDLDRGRAIVRAAISNRAATPNKEKTSD